MPAYGLAAWTRELDAPRRLTSCRGRGRYGTSGRNVEASLVAEHASGNDVRSHADGTGAGGIICREALGASRRE
jgi:hypothetical protein